MTNFAAREGFVRTRTKSVRKRMIDAIANETQRNAMAAFHARRDARPRKLRD
jgi:hypothetical protein